VVGLFKQKSSVNSLFVLFYGLVLKFPLFLRPPGGPLRQAEDHFLYNWLADVITPWHIPPVVYSIITFLLLYSQAMLVNRIFVVQRMLGNPNYLPAMAYMLITSLFPEWNQFSAPLLVNSFLIVIFYRLVNIHNAARAGAAIFNVGLLMGIVTLLYEPAVLFVLLVLFALFIMRPIRLREWLISLLGVTMPYYFLGILLYLTNKWDWKKLQPDITLTFPAMPTDILVTISLSLLILPFIVGGFMVNANLSKMFIHVRKAWSLLLLFLIISVFIILATGHAGYTSWFLCVVPLTGFHAAAYYFPSRGLFPPIMHWLLFFFAIYINYMPGH
jgi:hypothetical protein